MILPVVGVATMKVGVDSDHGIILEQLSKQLSIFVLLVFVSVAHEGHDIFKVLGVAKVPIGISSEYDIASARESLDESGYPFHNPLIGGKVISTMLLSGKVEAYNAHLTEGKFVSDSASSSSYAGRR